MAVSLKEFARSILASGLMTAGELREFRAQLPVKQLSAEAFGKELVRHGKLTQYQVARIYQGQHDGLILGKNVILDRIGSGGMGEVYKAQHLRMKRTVVIKVLHPESTDSETARRRFQREVEAAAQLYHPNIVTAFDADEEDGVHYLVMEYVEGKDLGSMISHGGPFEVDKALDCIIQAAKGLAYAHEQGIVHRDIKPSNLLLDGTGTIKVLDMGLARFDTPVQLSDGGSDELTTANQIVGTVDYMPPEQVDDSTTVDRRSDIYSLGCTLYRLLVGRPPYQGKSAINKLLAHRVDPIPRVRDTRKDVPKELDQVLSRMLAKLPDDRYANMNEVMNALQACRVLLSRAGGKPGSQSGIHAKNADTPGDSTDSIQIGEETRSTFTGTVRSLEMSSRRADPAVGIDLGTTYSAVAHLDDLGRPETLANAEGDKITPSVLLFEDDEVVVGKEAVKAMATEMDYVAECAKRELGTRFFRKSFDGQSYPPETLEAWILNKLRKDAWAAIGQFSKVVITVPAYFDEVRRKATQDAGYIAGFEVMDIINEPTAAAVAFGFQQGYLHRESNPAEPINILVYDLGGGTFDVTVMEIGGIDFVALATDGDVKLGGRDWDQRLVDHVAEEFKQTHGVDPREDGNAVGRLWRDCEDAKRTLSARTKTHISCDYKGQAIRVLVTRQQFEEMTQDLLDRTAFTTEQTIKAAGLQWSDIDRVLLVGGSTRMPAVNELLQRLSGAPPDCSVSPDEAVAHGAALHAGLLLDQFDGKAPRFHIRNVNSHSLGVAAVDTQTKRKQTAVLIPRNTSLPVSASRVFTTSKDDQRSVLVQIVEGESDNPDDCMQIGRCAVRELPPNLPVHTPIEVRFRYEENGRLSVRVRVADSDVRHRITRDNTLTEDQLNEWRQKICGLPPIDSDSTGDTTETQVHPFATQE